jgi:hypothetical protein
VGSASAHHPLDTVISSVFHEKGRLKAAPTIDSRSTVAGAIESRGGRSRVVGSPRRRLPFAGCSAEAVSHGERGRSDAARQFLTMPFPTVSPGPCQRRSAQKWLRCGEWYALRAISGQQGCGGFCDGPNPTDIDGQRSNRTASGVSLAPTDVGGFAPTCVRDSHRLSFARPHRPAPEDSHRRA